MITSTSPAPDRAGVQDRPGEAVDPLQRAARASPAIRRRPPRRARPAGSSAPGRRPGRPCPGRGARNARRRRRRPGRPRRRCRRSARPAAVIRSPSSSRTRRSRSIAASKYCPAGRTSPPPPSLRSLSAIASVPSRRSVAPSAVAPSAAAPSAVTGRSGCRRPARSARPGMRARRTVLHPANPADSAHAAGRPPISPVPRSRDHDGAVVPRSAGFHRADSRGADHVAVWTSALSIRARGPVARTRRHRCRWDASELSPGPPHDTSRGTHVRTDRHHGDVSPHHPRTRRGRCGPHARPDRGAARTERPDGQPDGGAHGARRPADGRGRPASGADRRGPPAGDPGDAQAPPRRVPARRRHRAGMGAGARRGVPLGARDERGGRAPRRWSCCGIRPSRRTATPSRGWRSWARSPRSTRSWTRAWSA